MSCEEKGKFSSKQKETDRKIDRWRIEREKENVYLGVETGQSSNHEQMSCEEKGKFSSKQKETDRKIDRWRIEREKENVYLGVRNWSVV